MPYPELSSTLRLFRPARFADRAIHIPFDKADGIVVEQPIQAVQQQQLHIFSPHIQDKLMACFTARTRWEMVDPLRMQAVDIAIRIDHLWLNPQPKEHSSLLHV